MDRARLRRVRRATLRRPARRHVGPLAVRRDLHATGGRVARHARSTGAGGARGGGASGGRGHRRRGHPRVTHQGGARVGARGGRRGGVASPRHARVHHPHPGGRRGGRCSSASTTWRTSATEAAARGPSGQRSPERHQRREVSSCDAQTAAGSIRCAGTVPRVCRCAGRRAPTTGACAGPRRTSRRGRRGHGTTPGCAARRRCCPPRTVAWPR